MRRARWLRVALGAAALAVPLCALADEALQAFVDKAIAAAREKYAVPAIAALVQVNGKAEALAVTGLRAAGGTDRATRTDRWHIGSDTKAVTATLIARLVERKVLSFDTTLAECFPAFAQEIDAGYRAITVAQLLSHTAGLPSLTDPKDLPAFNATLKTVRGVVAQRVASARSYLAQAPSGKAGEFKYSNLGYIIAGAVAEARTGKAWEELVREEVFAPLGIARFGFGAPGSPGKRDQPLGHMPVPGHQMPLEPDHPGADNPAALGPAGTLNITLEDWARFVQDQLDGAHGRGRLLRAETYRRLFTPVAGMYALGWGVRSVDGNPVLLSHAGSNGHWFALAQVQVPRETFVLIAINAGDAGAQIAAREISEALAGQLR